MGASRTTHGRRHVAGCLVLGVVVLAGCDTGGGPPDPGASTPPATAGILDDEGEVGTTGAPSTAPTPPPLHPSVDDYPAGRVMVDPGDAAELLPVLVRVADTPDRRQHGLMEVAELPDGVGMWFTYDTDRTGGFWMKGTETDLDIAWVDDSGRIVAIETMQVCTSDPCPSYEPGASYRRALEVRAGWFADHDVEVGDRILSGAGSS